MQPTPLEVLSTTHETPATTIIPQTLNNKHKEVQEQAPGLDSLYEDNNDEYPKEFYEEYQGHVPQGHGGLRERELLCPIMEEDNESTASGSTCNLAFTPREVNTVIGESWNIITSKDNILLTKSKCWTNMCVLVCLDTSL